MFVPFYKRLRLKVTWEGFYVSECKNFIESLKLQEAKQLALFKLEVSYDLLNEGRQSFI